MKTSIKPQDYNWNSHSLHVVDYASSYGEVFPKRKKSDWFDRLTKFVLRFERQYDITIKVIRTYNEFDTKEMKAWCNERGIRHQLTAPDESSSNGKVERRHRTIFDGMRPMMFDAPNSPRFLCSKALKHQYWLRNRLPMRANGGNKSPIELLKKMQA